MLDNHRGISFRPLASAAGCNYWFNLGICAPGTHYSWMAWASMESKGLILLHMTSNWNWTPNLWILSSTFSPLGQIILPWGIVFSNQWTNIAIYTVNTENVISVNATLTQITSRYLQNKVFLWILEEVTDMGVIMIPQKAIISIWRIWMLILGQSKHQHQWVAVSSTTRWETWQIDWQTDW